MNMPSRKELHAPLEQPLKKLLEKYKKMNHKQGPSSILMFRDGVGQSQVWKKHKSWGYCNLDLRNN